MRQTILSRLSAAAAMTVRHYGTAHRREKLVVIMGATGTGKTKLSLDVATRFPAEIVNSDKIQVYDGLDITTNKIPHGDRRGVPHHLLGSVDPSSGELPPSAFRRMAGTAIESISKRGKLPVIAGGSNSFIHALLSAPPPSGGLRYRCCFIWVDVEKETLMEYLDERVEEMVGSGMVEELENYFLGNPAELGTHTGLKKAIGVPEFQGYFRKKEPARFLRAVEEIKSNTRQLAIGQVEKIRRLGESGWALRRVDATGAVRARLGIGGAGKQEETILWEQDVAAPAFRAVQEFYDQDEDDDDEEDHVGLNMLPRVTSSVR